MIPGSPFTVYSIENVKTGRKYYGRTKIFRGRKNDHMKQLRSGSHYNQEMVADHAAGNDEWRFKILCEDLTQRQANVISDQFAKNDPTTYNLIGVVGMRKDGHKKLTREKANTIRELYFAGEYTQEELADLFNVTQGHISLVINGLVHNDGEFAPPAKEVPPEYEMARHLKEVLRKRYIELTKQNHSVHTAFTKLRDEFNLPKKCIRFWVNNEPRAVSSNQHHKPSDLHVIIDGVRYKTRAAFQAKTGISSRDLEKIGPCEYRVASKTVLVDGVPVEIEGYRTVSTLQKYGYFGLVRVSPGVYVTSSTKKLAKQNPLAASKLKKIALARKALANPVTTALGKIKYRSTAEKYKCSIYYMRLLENDPSLQVTPGVTE